MTAENNKIRNTRRISTDYQFLRDKKVNLKVYFKLQLESKWNQEYRENHRYIYKNALNFSKFATEIGIDRTTFKNGFNHLLTIGYIEKIQRCNGNIAYLLPNNSTLYTLVPFEDLNLLCNTTKEQKVTSNVIKVYTIIRSLTEFSKTNTCFQSRKLLAQRIGLSERSKDNLDVITECFKKLEEMELIESELVTIVEDGKVKTKRVSWSKNSKENYHKVKIEEDEVIPF